MLELCREVMVSHSQHGNCRQIDILSTGFYSTLFNAWSLHWTILFNISSEKGGVGGSLSVLETAAVMSGKLLPGQLSTRNCAEC